MIDVQGTGNSSHPAEVCQRIGLRLGEQAARQAAAILDGLLAGLPQGQTLDGDAAYGMTVSLYALLRERPPETLKIRVFNPDAEQHGWVSTHTVVEIVNDDMPFLVDSVSAELARLGIGLHLLLHPVFAVERDGQGGLLRLSLRSVGGAEPARLESVMHLAIDRRRPDQHAAIAASLTRVLDDTRLAVRDWQPMRERILAAAAELQNATTQAGPAETDEARAFLAWLHDNHFTFLGYRGFTFANGRSAPAIETESGQGLGLLTSPQARVFDDTRPLSEMPPDIRAFLTEPSLLLVTKSARLSSVHRPVHMDVIGIKRFDKKGKVVGLHAFLGLFTSVAYTRNPAQIPLLRRKSERVISRSGFAPNSHDAKALVHILETYPRDELFQIDDDELLATALGIVRLQQRPHAALFVRHDAFERFVTCLVFIPRDRYDTPLRLAITALLEQAFAGRLETFYTQVGDQPLARLHFIIRTHGGGKATPDRAALEAQIAEAARTWPEQIQSALVQAHGEADGVALAQRWAAAFPASYRERHSALSAVADIDRIETGLSADGIALNLYQPVDGHPHEARLKIYHRRRTLPLSDILPMLEAMGLKVISETPHEVRPDQGSELIWIHDFEIQSADGLPLDIAGKRPLFHEALERVWRGDMESDGFNRLILGAGLDWRQVTVLRAYAKYLRQAGVTYSQSYMEQALAANPEAAAALMAVFRTRFDPAQGPEDETRSLAEGMERLDRIDNADDDRILRRYLNLIRATLRTNYFQSDPNDAPKPYVAFKLDSRQVDDLPLPRPLVEIFVYSPRVEAIHLRGGRVARGGIRWSDRREDFRTEILGLMKAQMVKNAVIVPVGAKGGFVVKCPPPGGTREAVLAEAVACYRTMMRGLLDLTDNLQGAEIVPPANLRRHDGDDPYLVVAADKGTATFSDIANGISLEYGFWLGDAFASGGSQGYDHKKMGITARGAWEAVKRHFRELGIDPQRQDISVVGVGDMSGDVFGNAMLRSPHLRLLAAFNHAHIFIDPDPDPAASFAERQRLFALPRSAWTDYDPGLISPGGGVFSRTAKTIRLSPQARARFGIEKEQTTPAELIRTILSAPVDLLFFGGIGTYVKAAAETNADVGDRANDTIRVSAPEVRAKVVGEGANLGVTQRGRIEYGLGGGRINTDAIDNSAGVDCSDHEVNIKILLNGAVAAGDMTGKQRDALLAAMTDEVAELVLRDNYLQTQALSMMEAQGAELLDAQGRLMRLLERAGKLDRAIEFLPSDEVLTERAASRTGLARPELAVLLAYGKIWLHDHILGSELPDDAFLAEDLSRYFPTPLQDKFVSEIKTHRLRREIVATVVTNSIVNRVGGAFVGELMETTGHAPAQVARAYIVARDAFRLRDVWRAVEALDGSVPAAAQTAMLIEANRLIERATLWVLRCVPSPFHIAATIAELSPGVAALEQAVPTILPDDTATAVAQRVADFVAQGVPEPLARRVGNLIVLASAADIVRIAATRAIAIEDAGRLYFAVGARFGLGWLRSSAYRLAGRGHWQKLAAAAAIEDLYGHQRDITISVCAAAPGLPPDEAIAAWTATHGAAVERADALVAELKATHQIDLAMVTVANRQLRTLSEAMAAP